MTKEQPKYLFDECTLSIRAVDALSAVLDFGRPDYSATLEQKLRFQGDGEGVWDQVWIPKAAEEGWVVSAGLVNDETNVEFILIVDLETKTEVYNLMQNAVQIKNGHYSVEAYSWFAPEGIQFQR